ncbi:hypothetical protein ACQUFG_16650, partial [Enterococcus gallinarum]
MRAVAGKSKTEPAKAIELDLLGDNEPSLSDKAYDAILKGLFDRTIPLGAELSQADLVRLFG